MGDRLKAGDPDSLAAVLKRPHHELTTSKDETGMVVPSPVPLRSFLPPDARRAKPGEMPPPGDRLGLRLGQVATLSAAGDNPGVVALWTIRGASIRTEPLRRVWRVS